MCAGVRTLSLLQSLSNSSQNHHPLQYLHGPRIGKRKKVYAALQEKYTQFTKGNEFLTIPGAPEAVIIRTISLLMNVVTARRLIVISGDTMEEAVKSLQIKPKFLAKRSNTKWDIPLPNVKEANMWTGSVLMYKLVRLQTEYMGSWSTRITLHVVPMDFREEQPGVFLFRYGQVEDVLAVSNKAGIATGDYVLQITMTRKNFMDIPDILSCRGRNILFISEGRRLHCFFCGVTGHLSKACTEKNQHQQHPEKGSGEQKNRARPPFAPVSGWRSSGGDESRLPLLFSMMPHQRRTFRLESL